MKQDAQTEKFLEEAVKLAGEIPDNQKVYITGGNNHWLNDLGHTIKVSGLVGVEVVTMGQIRGGQLRGVKGKLLIDDVNEMNYKEFVFLFGMKKWLEGIR